MYRQIKNRERMREKEREGGRERVGKGGRVIKKDTFSKSHLKYYVFL